MGAAINLEEFETYSEHRDYRYTTEGHLVRRDFCPAKMSAYELATALIFRNPVRPSVYEAFFRHRVSAFVRRIFASRTLSEKKPSPTGYRRDLGLFESIFYDSLSYVLEPALAIEHSKKDLCYTDPRKRHITGELRTLNHNIFSVRFARRVVNLTKRFDAVANDVRAVQTICSDRDRFGELEELCQRSFWRFLHVNDISYIDSADQRQEGLITLWQAAQKYTGRNFARFNTFVGRSLYNKFVSLLRFYGADKRRVHKFTLPVGNGESAVDSHLADRIERRVFEAWQQGQRDLRLPVNGEAEDHDPFFNHDPFFTFSLRLADRDRVHPDDMEKDLEQTLHTVSHIPNPSHEPIIVRDATFHAFAETPLAVMTQSELDRVVRGVERWRELEAEHGTV